MSPPVLSGLVGLLSLAALGAVGLAIWRLWHGPQHADRIVALDILLAAAVALCVAAALGSGRTVFLDVAIGLALVGFVGTLGWARLIERAAESATTPTTVRTKLPEDAS